jgi:hypothetical protein
MQTISNVDIPYISTSVKTPPCGETATRDLNKLKHTMRCDLPCWTFVRF